MGVVVLAGAAGAPGVTTSALGLTLAWPRPALLADLDRDASQAVLAGYLVGTTPQRRGLVALAQAHREGRPLDLLGASLPLPPDHRQAFLPGFTHPGQAALFSPAWPALAHAMQALGSEGRDVVVDAGRLGAGLPAPMLSVADQVLVVTGSSLRALAAVRHHLAGLAESLGERPGVLGLLVVGPGRPYAGAEIASQFGVPVVAELPWEPAYAAILSDGTTASIRRPKLATALGDVARRLATGLDRRREELGAA